VRWARRGECRGRPLGAEDGSRTPARTGVDLTAVSAGEGHHAPVLLVEHVAAGGDVCDLHGPFGHGAGLHDEAVLSLRLQRGEGEEQAALLHLSEEVDIEDLVGPEAAGELFEARQSQLIERVDDVRERVIAEKRSH
jgi:hypothetical protein